MIDEFAKYLRERIAAYPGLTAKRLMREIRARGYEGGYTSVKDFVREARPPKETRFERRFETPPGKQAQVDFAEFTVGFTDEPGVVRKVWLFSWFWAIHVGLGLFCASQNLQTVMRCHIAAFGAMGGAPEEVLYDRRRRR